MLITIFGAAVLSSRAKQATSDNPDNKTEIVANPKATKSTDRFPQYKASENLTMKILVFTECCATEAYKDAVGIPTINVGNCFWPDGTPVKMGDKITSQEQIKGFVKAHWENKDFPALQKYITRKLSPNEEAAIRSLIYNCGAGILGKDGVPSELSKAINTGNTSKIISEVLKRHKTRKGPLKGLLYRRIFELGVYFNMISEKDIDKFIIGGTYNLLDNKPFHSLIQFREQRDKKGKNVFHYNIPRPVLEKAARYITEDCSMQIKDPDFLHKNEKYGVGRKIHKFFLDLKPNNISYPRAKQRS